MNRLHRLAERLVTLLPWYNESEVKKKLTKNQAVIERSAQAQARSEEAIESFRKASTYQERR